MKEIAIGSIVRLTVSGTRSSEGEPCQIPAIVLGQYDDGVVRLFCFHFEGQFLSTARPQDLQVVFDAGRLEASSRDDLADVVQSDIATLQRQFVEFQEQVLGMITAPQAAEPPAPVVEPELDLTGTAGPVDSTRRRR